MEHISYTDEQVQDFVFDILMESIHANLYITDIETNEIIFMSGAMRETFGIRQAEGNICWKVLQKGMDGPCPFCPIKDLLCMREKHEKRPVIKRTEENTLLDRIYENYDTLIEWIDGRLVHLQHSVDITDYMKLSKEASIDELTHMLNRRAGKLYLSDRMEEARQCGVVLSVTMYDLNGLKQINDLYGHKEGDRAISLIAETVLQNLKPEDGAFRLSGDEFVVIFWAVRREKAAGIMKQILEQMKKQSELGKLPYEVSFCYGVVEINPAEHYTVTEVIAKADAIMYDQKREYHIHKAEQAMALSDEDWKKKIEEFTYDKDHLYDALIESTETYIYIGNMKTGTFRYPPAMVKEFELPGQIVPNAAVVWGARVHPYDKKAFLDSNQEVADGRTESHNVEYRAKNYANQWVWLRCRGHMIRDEHGEPELFAGMITNLGKKNRVDHTTGLYNKFELEEEICRRIQKYPQAPFGVILLGLDDFTHINDLYDRVFGDEVLRITSQKIISVLPADSAVFRMDGDEFCILMRNGDIDEFKQFYARIQYIFQNQQQYNGKRYYCTVSGGMALYPENGKSYLSLIKYAAYALEYSKNNGKNRMTIFDKSILKYKKRELSLTELLRESMEDGFRDFYLCYQPQVNMAEGKISGAEALARWNCEKYGNVPPLEFIPILEQSGMIIPVGRWIMEEAIRQCSEWRAINPEFVMSINLSYLQIIDPEFISCVKETVERYQIPYQNIVFELTETYLVKEKENLKRIFDAILDIGFGIAMDDFGTGYSSLGVLKDIPVSFVKIDQAFVRGIESAPLDAAFIQFIVSLCHDVGKKVCLEGVETEQEYNIVKKSGLEYIQGYYFGRPVTKEEFEKLYLDKEIKDL